ncbi:helix-turn-helix domain-containing protein, partial [Nocardioides sp. SYSU DS0651]|uniref:helix-turn-helix domain-containing protein n=1 Tax=Nocardioides sp. SYSU DS0651 TaxID=3415955 RepID=UPI003F4B2C74
MNATAGELIREWRQRRHLSQLELAGRADVSTRHLSYLENGRSRPTSAMILRLCDHLEVPLREQNELLLAAGHAPVHPEHGLDDPPMAEANAALEAILQAHGPYPALVVDRHWELVTANEAAFSLLDGIDEDLLEPPVNVLRLSVHPRGLAPRIVNLEEWRAMLAERLRREYDATGDQALRELLEDVGGQVDRPRGTAALVVPL